MRVGTLGDGRGVSPVIGVVLLMAITVVLSAVGATFALGLADAGSPPAPQVTWDLYHDDDGAVGANAVATITHEGGDTLDAARLTTYVDGTPIGSATGYTLAGGGWAGEVTAGAELRVVKTGSDTDWTGETIRVVWEHDREDVSATLVRYTPR
jgi:flagellin-like protein